VSGALIAIALPHLLHVFQLGTGCDQRAARRQTSAWVDHRPGL